MYGKPFSFKNRSNDLKRIVKPVITANWIVNGIFSAPYILLYVIKKGGHILICLMSKILLENADYLCYSKFVFVRFDLLSNLHDQKECDNYFAICGEANMLTTLKNKN